MLRRGHELLRDGTYVPSRSPGYPLPEVVIAITGYAGGFLLSNAVSALLGGSAVACFYLLARDAFGSRAALLSAAAAGLNPHWIVASSSSMDYVYALAFCLAGVLALRHGRLYAAAPLLAMSVASRLTYLPLGVIAYACMAFLPSARRGHVLAAALLFVALALAPYAAIYHAVGASMIQVYTGQPIGFFSFEGYAHLSDYVGRFVFKNISFWGAFLVPVLAAAGLAWWRRGRRRNVGLPGAPVPGIALAGIWAAIVYTEALFFRLPLEIPYLLPMLFPVVFLLNLVPRARFFLACVLVGHLVYGLVSLDLLKVRYLHTGFNGRVAAGATFGPSFGPGVLIQDLSLRHEAEAYHVKRFGLSELKRGLPEPKDE
jgi:hypothetical protein